jgi:hypothetical protein
MGAVDREAILSRRRRAPPSSEDVIGRDIGGYRVIASVLLSAVTPKGVTLRR